MERWIPTIGFDDRYEVSDLGRVRSTKTGHVMAFRRSMNGYLVVKLSIQGRKLYPVVHGIVARAFHGPRPEGFVCRHLDGNKLNNKPSNLRWGTPQENSHDSMRHGTLFHPRGEANGARKISEAQALEILRRTREGESDRSIAADMGVSPALPFRIRKGTLWAYLGGRS